MKIFLRNILKFITFCGLSYGIFQVILIALLIPMFLFFSYIELNPNIFYGIIAIVSMILSFFGTKAIFSDNKKTK